MNKRVVSSSTTISKEYDQTTETLKSSLEAAARTSTMAFPCNLHRGIMRAPSEGQFVNAHIKDRYAFSRVG